MNTFQENVFHVLGFCLVSLGGLSLVDNNFSKRPFAGEDVWQFAPAVILRQLRAVHDCDYPCVRKFELIRGIFGKTLADILNRLIIIEICRLRLLRSPVYLRPEYNCHGSIKTLLVASFHRGATRISVVI